MPRVLIGTAFVCALAAAAAQQPEPFRLEVSYVEVDAVVTDCNGRFVTGLNASDFELLEAGTPQKIAAFATVDLPLPVPVSDSARHIEPDIVTNVHPVQGRLYAIVLDDLHTDALRAPLVKAAARQFIERHIGPADLVAIVPTSGSAAVTQDFSSSRRRAAEAIDRFTGQKLRSDTLNRLDLFRQDAQSGLAGMSADPIAAERAAKARPALLTIGTLTESLAAVQGRRKAILYFSEGIEIDVRNYLTNREAPAVYDALRDVVAAATRANVHIYSIDVRGLTSAGSELAEAAGIPLNPHLGLGPESLLNEVQVSQDSLRVLAEATGGFAVIDGNDFAAAFPRIVSENSSYYVLGFYPSESARDGQVRPIKVRTRRPGLTVKARQSYLAPRRVSSPQPRRTGAQEIAAALNRVLPHPT